MDIATVVPQAREVPILHPATEAPIGLVIKLLPMSHPKVKAVSQRIRNSRVTARKLKVTAESLEAEGVEVMVSAIEGWEWQGDATFQGSKPDCTEANVRAVLKLEFIRQQIDRELGDDAAFFPS